MENDDIPMNSLVTFARRVIDKHNNDYDGELVHILAPKKERRGRYSNE